MRSCIFRNDAGIFSLKSSALGAAGSGRLLVAFRNCEALGSERMRMPMQTATHYLCFVKVALIGLYSISKATLLRLALPHPCSSDVI